MGIVCRSFLHFCFVADPNPPGDEYELITGIRIRIRPLVSPEIFITRRKQIIIPELGSRHATMFRKRVNVFRASVTLIIYVLGVKMEFHAYMYLESTQKTKKY